ncbi:hypothetical protein EDC30_102229 [Paucimonas lemoignei]|uniref:Uncharacterized protein n=1 Tax=Paucimonas lemoignei TaxID=29443 RepID=A0A4V2UJ35_PAULE|nr:hypothetical protein [Paucimonas lemoignei]TCS38490.1 hypothetical protein EDC30_102229 [Paucimonas lemoignei]
MKTIWLNMVGGRVIAHSLVEIDAPGWEKYCASAAAPAVTPTDEEILSIFHKEIEGEGFALYEVTPGDMIRFARRLLAGKKES